jgi:hypothetical protein
MSRVHATATKNVTKTRDGRAAVTLNSITNRSAITNGDLLPGVDHRSTWARRVKDLIALHVSDLGGDDCMSEAEFALVRRAAVLTSQLEHMELRFASGESEPKILEVYGRTVNTLRRTLEAIGIKRRARDITPPSPLQYARQHGAVE